MPCTPVGPLLSKVLQQFRSEGVASGWTPCDVRFSSDTSKDPREWVYRETTRINLSDTEEIVLA